MIQFRCSVFGIAILLVFVGSRDLAAQRPHPVGAQTPVIFSDTSTDRVRAPDPNSCPGKRFAVSAIGPIAGAAAGFISFSLTIGALASDRGEIYQRYRRRSMLAGAALGTGMGLFKAMTRSCDEIFAQPQNHRFQHLIFVPIS